MATRAIMNPTKVPCGAVTMVHQDHFFLERWVDHYGKQFGREHLYVLSHGDDPEHARIAEGANVIRLPRDPTLHRLTRRRWSFKSQFAAGMLRYYNWIFVGDVDEVVIVDPDVAPDLVTYMRRKEGRGTPLSICPFGIELIHNPAAEPDPIVKGEPILSKRRVFRANANYAKPCIIRKDAMFTIGGHANNHLPRVLDPHLFLLHLRFVDYDISVERLTGRKAMRQVMTDGVEPEGGSGYWGKNLDDFKLLSSRVAVREDAELPEFRKKMIDDQKLLHDGTVAFFGGARTKELYRLPDRFAGVF
jgi:Glycosyl transferase family 2